MKTFAGRTAVVTGGASGLGAAMARLFASEGMRIVVADIAADGAAEVARSLEASGAKAVAARVDVGDPPRWMRWRRRPPRPSGAATCWRRTSACSASRASRP